MNFQDLVNQPNVNMQVFATVRSVGNIEFTQAKGTAKQRCSLCDDAGETQWATIYPGNNPELQQSHINQRLEFNLSANAGQGKGAGKMYYGGFWECPNPQETQQAPQTQQAPPQNQQQAQAPPRQGSKTQGYNQPVPPHTAPTATRLGMPSDNAPQGEPQRNMTYAYEVTPGVAARITRSVALEAASRLMLGKSDCSPQDVLSMAIAFCEWVATGEIPMSQTPQPGTDDTSPDFP